MFTGYLRVKASTTPAVLLSVLRALPPPNFSHCLPVFPSILALVFSFGLPFTNLPWSREWLSGLSHWSLIWEWTSLYASDASAHSGSVNSTLRFDVGTAEERGRDYMYIPIYKITAHQRGFMLLVCNTRI